MSENGFSLLIWRAVIFVRIWFCCCSSVLNSLTFVADNTDPVCLVWDVRRLAWRFIFRFVWPRNRSWDDTTLICRFCRSFVPPARDEESATQRKAHAKRIRETRRSTQGISLEEIQNAELLIRKNAVTANNNQSVEAVEKVSDETVATTIVSEAIPQKVVIPADVWLSPFVNIAWLAPVASRFRSELPHSGVELTQAEDASEAGCFVAVTLPFNSNNVRNAISTTATIATGGSERRPSWRLRLDPGCKVIFINHPVVRILDASIDCPHVHSASLPLTASRY